MASEEVRRAQMCLRKTPCLFASGYQLNTGGGFTRFPFSEHLHLSNHLFTIPGVSTKCYASAVFYNTFISLLIVMSKRSIYLSKSAFLWCNVYLLLWNQLFIYMYLCTTQPKPCLGKIKYMSEYCMMQLWCDLPIFGEQIYCHHHHHFLKLKHLLWALLSIVPNTKKKGEEKIKTQKKCYHMPWFPGKESH